MRVLAVVSDDVSLGIKCPLIFEKKVALQTCHGCNLFCGYASRDLIRCAAPRPGISLDDHKRDLMPPPLWFLENDPEEEDEE